MQQEYLSGKIIKGDSFDADANEQPVEDACIAGNEISNRFHQEMITPELKY